MVLVAGVDGVGVVDDDGVVGTFIYTTSSGGK